MKNHVFTADYPTTKPLTITEGAPIADVAKTLTTTVTADVLEKGSAFADKIDAGFISDFEKPGDKMAHVSTFIVVDDMVLFLVMQQIVLVLQSFYHCFLETSLILYSCCFGQF